MKDKYRIGKVHISITNPSNAIARITENAVNKIGGYVCVSNLRMVRYAGNHPEYQKLMRESFMNLPDGTPLMWCGRLWGLNVECTNGPATFKSMLKRGDEGLRHYLLGDTQDVLDRIIELNDKEYHAKIVGAEALPFASVENFDYENIANRVKASGANIVWTAMRAPKQDEFNKILNTYLPNVICVGVGRAFRMLTGEVKQAPRWAQKFGITGIFTRKKSLFKTFLWYFESFFYLIGYFTQILWGKMSGKKYYE